MKKLCGVNPPVITIFDEKCKIDIEASKRQADFLISKGVDGLAGDIRRVQYYDCRREKEFY